MSLTVKFFSVNGIVTKIENDSVLPASFIGKPAAEAGTYLQFEQNCKFISSIISDTNDPRGAIEDKEIEWTFESK